MTTKRLLLILFIFLLTGQLVAWVIYYFWNERYFIPMVFGSFGSTLATWIQQRNALKK